MNKLLAIATSKQPSLIIRHSTLVKLAVRTGEQGFGCLSPVCGGCLFRIVTYAIP